MKFQQWLESQEKYNTKEKREGVKELDISKQDLEGELDLSDFVSLKELNCDSNKLTSLNVANCPNIEKISAWENRIKKVIGIEKLVNLSELNIADNELEEEPNLAENTKLSFLFIHDNPNIKKVEIGDTPNLVRFGGGSFPDPVFLSWAGIIKKNWDEIAGKLGIGSEQIQGASVEKVKELVVKKIDELKSSKDNQKPDGLPENWQEQLKSIAGLESKIKQAEKFGLTDWDNLATQTQGETLTSLLARPKKSDLEKVEKERDGRPNIEKEKWDNDYSKRPTKNELDKVQAELDKIKNAIKSILGLSSANNLPDNWSAGLVKKGELEAAQKNLKEWTDKFPGKNPTLVENENRRVGTVDSLQNELNNWRNGFPGKTPQMVAQEINNANQNMVRLNDWQNRFPGRNATQVQNEINQLRARPVGPTLTADHQQKLNEWRQLKAEKIVMGEWIKEWEGLQWEAKVLKQEEINKYIGRFNY